MSIAKIRLTLAAGMLAALGVSGAVQADPITFIKGQTISIKFQDYEFASVTVGSNIGGIFQITSIQDLGGTTLWTPAAGGGPISDGSRLLGFYSNLTITSGTGGIGALTASGGVLVVYNVPFGTNLDASTLISGINPTTQLCGGAACPTPWLTTKFVPGILAPGDTTSTLAGNVVGTNPITGNGNGYMDVANDSGTTVNNGAGGSFLLTAGLGANNGLFNSAGFGPFGGGVPNADLSFRSGFDQCGFPTSPPQCVNVAGNPKLAFSNDPVAAKVLPEPGTLALLGAVVVGLGLAGRRRKS